MHLITSVRLSPESVHCYVPVDYITLHNILAFCALDIEACVAGSPHEWIKCEWWSEVWMIVWLKCKWCLIEVCRFIQAFVRLYFYRMCPSHSSAKPLRVQRIYFCTAWQADWVLISSVEKLWFLLYRLDWKIANNSLSVLMKLCYFCKNGLSHFMLLKK